MQDTYDIFGSLPDSIETNWIENAEELEKHIEYICTSTKMPETPLTFATTTTQTQTPTNGNNAQKFYQEKI